MVLTFDIPVYSVAIVGALIINVGLYLCNLPILNEKNSAERKNLKKGYFEAGFSIIVITLLCIFFSISGGLIKGWGVNIGGIIAGFSVGILLILIMLMSIFFYHSKENIKSLL